MIRLGFAALLAIVAAPVAAETVIPVQPSFDSPDQRRTLRALSNCLAESRPRWARQTLALPYLSDAQARAASEVLNGSDRCIFGEDVEVTFRTSSMIASLAEHYLRDEMAGVDWDALVQAMDTMAPRNASEDFAYCVAVRNPDAARDLAMSDFGSPAETEAAARLGGVMEGCFNPGESRTVDLQSLRALVSTALYRGVTTINP